MRVRVGSNLASRLALGVRLSLVVGALSGCGSLHAAGPSGSRSAGNRVTRSARVELREVDHHPPINLVIRLGDPQPAIAFASAHDGS
ncbi:MAG: hypothetical protein ABW061_11465, partial [Polyangiaceae bacterium]